MTKKAKSEDDALILGPDGHPITEMDEDKDLLHAKQVWVGRPKIGKTSTAAALGQVANKYGFHEINPFFLLFEAGSGGVKMQGTSKPCPTCKGTGKDNGKAKCAACQGSGSQRHVLSTMADIEKWFEWAAASPFNPIVIDTGDALMQTVMDAVCVDLKIPSPYGANDNGISWAVIFDKMRELLSILDEKGVILLMHMYMIEKRTRTGSVPVATFNIPGKTRGYISGWANQILFFDILPKEEGEGDERVVIAEPQAGIEAGDQWHMFPPKLSLGESAAAAAEAMLEVFGYLEQEKK
jgi:hypothetical protein